MVSLNSFLSASLYALAVLVACESVLLLMILRQTLSLARILKPSPTAFRDDDINMLRRMPDFRAPLLDSERHISNKDLIGAKSLILFLSLRQEWGMTFSRLDTVIRGMWEAIDGCLYLACEGSESDCRDIQEQFRLKQRYADDIAMIVDSRGELKEQFHVTSPLSAIMFDELGRVLKSGYLLGMEGLQTDAGRGPRPERL